MSYDLIKQGLQKVGQVTSWHSLLIKYNHKSHPNEFICYDMHFASPEALTETITSMCREYIKKVDDFEGKVEEYTGFNSKNIVDKLSTSNALINESWNSLLQHINNSDDTKDLKDIQANAFIFTGAYLDANQTYKNIYLLTRKNPILNFKRSNNIFTSRHNTISKTSEPLVQFSKCFDALIFNDIVYMINSNCESIFNMEYSHRKICKKCIEYIESTGIIKDTNVFNQYATSGQNPKKFITYDANIVNKLKEPKWQKHLSKAFHIPYDSSTKQFDLSNTDHAKNFLLTVCGKTKSNIFDDGLCEVPTSTPINVS